MTRQLRFTKLDVFTSTPYVGNPLAIVHVPSTVKLAQAEKQLIAREFNLSETVFHHEQDAAGSGSPVVIDIFTTTEELPFAGHPTIGSGFFLLSRAPKSQTVTLRIKAGDIPVVRTTSGVRLQVPIDFKVHAPLSIPSVKQSQPQLTDADYVNAGGAEGCASVVKGMTFLLVALASDDALARVQPYTSRLTIPDAQTKLGAWGVGFAGIYLFHERPDGTVRTRMFDGTLEDPATGSAASTLGGWLALRRGPGVHTIDIEQGIEMGRRSEIRVVVSVGESGIEKIELEGAAVQVMTGALDI
ncbi:Phenazine biosynthesis PhzC/PhzF protein [Mycena sanguinolenta]|uniref:Phenazine biosynthesis PhzC/PhzF protein n=1 Tax=Mycena sanguinolenta TaxID=230812 RepID=A0A8H7DM69_9AGAR|nr:Phenazine biosynthesis PhzC/PhzF protein [Mycena sanguinolenta]